MVDRLNELLKGEFRVIYAERWAHVDGPIDYSKKKGHYDIVLIDDRLFRSICKISVQDFKVISTEGYMLTSSIGNINEALATIRESEDESV